MNFYTLWLRRVLFSSQTLFQFSSLFSLFGLVLAVASLTAALLAINGFSAGLEKILVNRQGHILVQPAVPSSKEEILEELSFYREEIDRELFFFSFEALLVKDRSFKGVLFEAIEDDKIDQFSFLKTSLLEGSLNHSKKMNKENLADRTKKDKRRLNHSKKASKENPSEKMNKENSSEEVLESFQEGNVESLTKRESKNLADSLFIGSELAKALNVSVGSRLSAVIAESEDPLFSRKRTDFQVKAILDFGRHDFNSSFALLPLSSAQKLGFDKLSGVKLWLKDSRQSLPLSQKLSQSLPPSYSVKSWMSADPAFFEIIQSDKKIIFFVLIILVISAGFNVSSSLFIQVFKRTKEINLLKALGVESSHLRNLFLLNGLILGFAGSIFGIILGLFVCWLLILIQNKWSFIPAQTYQINEIVWEWSFSDLFLIFFVSLFVITLSSVLPARRASKLNIKTALSYD